MVEVHKQVCQGWDLQISVSHSEDFSFKCYDVFYHREKKVKISRNTKHL